MLAIILAGALLGGTALILAGRRPEPRRVPAEAKSKRNPRRRG